MLHSVTVHRRALHRIPELHDQLPETLRYVRSVLEPLGCTLTSPTPGSLCAFFDAGRQETTAFRADLDALPVTETTGADYASLHPGCMHACGHDGHTATALALAGSRSPPSAPPCPGTCSSSFNPPRRPPAALGLYVRAVSCMNIG